MPPLLERAVGGSPLVASEASAGTVPQPTPPQAADSPPQLEAERAVGGAPQPELAQAAVSPPLLEAEHAAGSHLTAKRKRQQARDSSQALHLQSCAACTWWLAGQV